MFRISTKSTETTTQQCLFCQSAGTPEWQKAI